MLNSTPAKSFVFTSTQGKDHFWVEWKGFLNVICWKFIKFLAGMKKFCLKLSWGGETEHLVDHISILKTKNFMIHSALASPSIKSRKKMREPLFLSHVIHFCSIRIIMTFMLWEIMNDVERGKKTFFHAQFYLTICSRGRKKKKKELNLNTRIR